MFFEFNILGLLLGFVLVVLYYYKDYKDRYPYNLIVWFSYLLQLFYVITYIGIENGNYIIFGKLYFICLLVLMGLFSVYNIVYIIRDKYKVNSNIKNKKLKLVNIFSLVTFVLFGFLVLVSKFNLINGSLVFENNIISIVMWGLVLFNSIVNIVSKNNKIMGVNALLFLMMVVNYFYSDIGVVNSFMVFISLMVYILYENFDKKELEIVKLQRDYANRNIIDKYAFLKNISYEIRGPINTIDGLSQMVIDSDIESGILDDLKDIRVASRDLIDIINGMIDLSIIESGSLEIINDNYNVYDMFDNIKNIVSSRIRDRNIKFSCKVDKNIPEVLLGDSERISQVLLGLIGNSIKFTKKGSINLDVKCVRNDSLVRLIIKVSDTGEGIKSELLDTIFDKKKDNSIGLVLAKYLVELMNGKIEVNSIYGKGTDFIVSIDQKIIAEHENKRTKEVKVFKAVGKKVLVVDDNKLNLKVITKMLAPYEVEVIEASSGSECLDILDKTQDFDLIFMDDMMPKLSGTDTLAIIKKISRIDGYYIPVVVLTANVMSGIKEKYLGVGFDDYLAKPIEKQELARIMSRYLKGRKNKNGNKNN